MIDFCHTCGAPYTPPAAPPNLPAAMSVVCKRCRFARAFNAPILVRVHDATLSITGRRPPTPRDLIREAMERGALPPKSTKR